jgi:hypothetical protein
MTSKGNKNLDLISSLQQKKVVDEEKEVKIKNYKILNNIGKRRR